MPEVLNPALYRRLKRQFGMVKLVNAGQAMIARATHDVLNKPMLVFEQDGEYMRVNCPYCRDTRFRLYVNHMFGKRDVHGRKMNFLAYCFNEGCLYRENNRRDFVDTLEADINFLEEATILPGEVLSDKARTVMWPGPCKPLDRLPVTHHARGYLLSRGFDPDEISKKYKVCYCKDSHFFLARDRLIIPVFEHDELKGWQARYIGELPWKDRTKRKDLPPKYFSCPTSQFRSRCIYNYDRMRAWKTGVIVEGPTDVWRFGLMAGCIFGNTVTQQQKTLLLNVFRRRTLVMVLDPEEFNSSSTQDTVAWFKRRMAGKFCAVQLPEGTDPGSLEKQFLREYVRQEARKQGVSVVYRRVA